MLNYRTMNANPLPRRLVLQVISATCLACLLNAKIPNIIVIMTDDQGWGDLSIHGNNNIETPNIDQLANEGALFENFYVQPASSPTRAEFLTGRYYPRTGVYDTEAGGERLNLDEYTIAEAFKEAGYRTALFGKWHNGSQYPYHPMTRGFDQFYGFSSGHWGLYFNPMIEENGVMIRGNGYLPDDCTDRAIQFITKSNAETTPFFIYLAYNTPHSPMQVPDQYWQRLKDKKLSQPGTNPTEEDITHTKAALAMCENIDWNVGKLTQTLEHLEIEKDTIILFMSDNGPNSHRWNGGLKGIKGSVDEGGVKSPLVIRWTGTIPAEKSISEISAVIDIFPTLLDLTNIQSKSQKSFDGKSLKPLLLQDKFTWEERVIFSYWNDQLSARTQRFRLDPDFNLFDLKNDPGQTIDAASRFPESYIQMRQAVKIWKRDIIPKKIGNNRPFTVGHESFNISYLSVRDARSSGRIKRSSNWRSDSYFENWTSTDDRITWNIELLKSGLYTIDVWYACPEKDVGSVIELMFNGQKTSATVLEPHDPPILGEKYTRSQLEESPVKIFRTMSLGTVELTKGLGTLSLQALQIPGDQAAQIRMISFTRVQNKQS